MKEIDCFIDKSKEIYIYGAGHYGMAMHSYLIRKHKDNFFKGYLVTNKAAAKCMDMPVYQIDEIESDSNVGIVVAMSEEEASRLCYGLREGGWDRVIGLSKKDLEKLDASEYELSDSLISEISVENIHKRESKNVRWNNILIIKLDGIGDAVLCSAFVREIRKNHKDSHITVVCRPETYEIWGNCPFVDECVTFERGKDGKIPLLFEMKKCETFVNEELAWTSFDVALVPRFDTDFYLAGFIAYYSGARMRCTYSEKVTIRKRQENRNYNLLYTDLLDEMAPEHEVRKNNRILEWLGDVVENEELEVWDNEKTILDIRTILSERKFSRFESIIALGISGGAYRKRWSVSNYMRLIEKLTEWNDRIGIIVLGDSQNKEEICNLGLLENNKMNNVLNLAGELTLLQTISVLKNTKIYIGNDTGIMHIAAACKNAVVELNHVPEPVDDDSEYGNVRFAPWRTPYAIVRPVVRAEYEWRKDNRIIDQITPDQVIEALKKVTQ